MAASTATRKIFATALLLALTTACDARSAFEVELPDGTQIDLADGLTLNDGATLALVVTVVDHNGNPLDVDLTWRTSDSDIATVDADGVITAHRPGEATISASAGNVRDSTRVHVRQVPVRLEYVAGADQQGQEYQPLSDPLRVRVLDRHDDPVADVSISFDVINGGGSLLPANTATDAQGYASSTWTLGASGAQQVRSVARPPAHVSVIPDSAIIFVATAVADEPDPEAPAAVTDLQVTDVTETAVTLRWTAVPDGAGGSARYALRYGTPTIQWSAAHATEVAVPSGQNGTPVTHTFTSLTAGTAYQFQLVSYRGTLNVDAVFGDRSNVVAATTDEGEPPPPPALVAGTASATAGNGQVTLAAGAASGGTAPYSYQWHGGTSDPGASPSAATLLSGLTTLNATHTSLTNGTTYHYRLVVTDQAGVRAVSNAISATPAGSGTGGAQTLLHENWSGGIDTDVWSDGYNSEHHSVVADPTGSGRGQVLRARHTDNGGAGHLAHWTHGNGEVNPTGELFVRTWMYVPADFDGSNYAKMLFIKGNRMDDRYSGFGQAGNPSNGSNFFSAYLSYGAPGHSDSGIHFYTYHVDMSGVYGDIDYTRSAPASELSPAPGAWHKVEFWVKQNTIGQSDGAQRIWIDDELVLEWTGIRFRTQNILQANSVALVFSSSNNQGQVWYVDDVYVMDRQPTGMAGW